MPGEKSFKTPGKTTDNNPQMGDEFAAKQHDKKGALSAPFFVCRRDASALGELERTPGLGAAILLALDHARVAGQESAALQDAAQVGLEGGERLGDAVAHR